MSQQEEVIIQLAEWLTENAEFSLRIEDVARRSGYSRWHLQRIFTKIMNKSISCFIREIVLERAKTELISGNETIIEIAYKYGFSSQQSFTRTFKGHFKIPPASFRKQYLLNMGKFKITEE